MESMYNYMFLGAWLLVTLVLTIILIVWGSEQDESILTMKTIIMVTILSTVYGSAIHFTNL